MTTGTLVLVVGPSGAGKDSIIAAAKSVLDQDRRFVFPRRIVTREPLPAAEDHDTLPPDEFDRLELAGGFLLSWRAHGLAYGLPGSLRQELNAGNVVVANVSRSIVAKAEGCGARVRVFNIVVPQAILAERIARRGRETKEQVVHRLQREQPLDCVTAELIHLKNDGPIEQAASEFIGRLLQMAIGSASQ